ncbi:MAG: hypothetical protein WD059_13475 [Balneolaceae bacterium]
MKSVRFLSYAVALLLGAQSFAFANTNDGAEKLKKYINDIVQKVEETEDADEKRTILNESFDKMVTVLDKVEKMHRFSEEEKNQVAALKKIISERQDELNGENGFARVQNSQLNNYANFVQQNMEQAQNYITISAGLAVVIVLLLLLL